MIEETILDSIKFPQHWKPIRFREVFNYREKLTKQEMPILGTNVNLGVTERFEGDGRPAASEDLTKYKLVEPGDIVMNPLGKPHGSIGISDKSGITSPAYWVLRCNEGFYGKYLHYLLRTELILTNFAGGAKICRQISLICLGKNLEKFSFLFQVTQTKKKLQII